MLLLSQVRFSNFAFDVQHSVDGGKSSLQKLISFGGRSWTDWTGSVRRSSLGGIRCVDSILLLDGLQPEEGTRLRAHTRKTSLACAALDSRHASWLPGSGHYALVIRRTRKQASYQLTFGGDHLGTVETINFDRYLFFKWLLIASMRLLHLSTKLQYNTSDLAVSHQLAALLHELAWLTVSSKMRHL